MYHRPTTYLGYTFHKYFTSVSRRNDSLLKLKSNFTVHNIYGLYYFHWEVSNWSTETPAAAATAVNRLSITFVINNSAASRVGASLQLPQLFRLHFVISLTTAIHSVPWLIDQQLRLRSCGPIETSERPSAAATTYHKSQRNLYCSINPTIEATRLVIKPDLKSVLFQSVTQPFWPVQPQASSQRVPKAIALIHETSASLVDLSPCESGCLNIRSRLIIRIFCDYALYWLRIFYVSQSVG